VDTPAVYQIVSSDGSSTDEIRHVQIRGVGIACKAPLGWKLRYVTAAFIRLPLDIAADTWYT